MRKRLCGCTFENPYTCLRDRSDSTDDNALCGCDCHPADAKPDDPHRRLHQDPMEEKARRLRDLGGARPPRASIDPLDLPPLPNPLPESGDMRSIEVDGKPTAQAWCPECVAWNQYRILGSGVHETGPAAYCWGCNALLPGATPAEPVYGEPLLRRAMGLPRGAAAGLYCPGTILPGQPHAIVKGGGCSRCSWCACAKRGWACVHQAMRILDKTTYYPNTTIKRPLAVGLYDVVRKTDQTGVSGTGRVAQLCVFEDESACTRWLTGRDSTVAWAKVEDAIHVHLGAHPDATELKPVRVRALCPGCAYGGEHDEACKIAR